MVGTDYFETFVSVVHLCCDHTKNKTNQNYQTNKQTNKQKQRDDTYVYEWFCNSSKVSINDQYFLFHKSHPVRCQNVLCIPVSKP